MDKKPIDKTSRNRRNRGGRRKTRSKGRGGNKSGSVVVAPGQAAPMYAVSPAKPIVDRSSTAAALAWANMMMDPKNTKVVLSPNPGNVPVNTCVARFNYVREIRRDQTVDGNFAVIATPSVKDPLIIQSLNARYPSAGNTKLTASTIGLLFTNTATTAGFPSAGWLTVQDAVTLLQVALLNMRQIDGRGAWSLIAVGAGQVTFYFANKGNSIRYVRPYAHLGVGNWQAAGGQQAVPAGGAASVVYNNGADVDAITIASTDADGNPHAPVSGAISDVHVNIAFSTAYVPPDNGPGTVGQFVSDDLAVEGVIENVRVTAMSLLVTPIGQWANIGGRLVMARTLASNLVGAGGVPELMSKIEQLNDPYQPWIDCPLSKGGYGWWMPDDTDSYSVHPYGTTPSPAENVLVCAGNMLEGNSVRVVASYVVEFLSPKQVFTKQIGPTLDGAYLTTFKMLTRTRAVSENEEHEAFIARIKNAMRSALNVASSAVKFASDHRGELLAAAEIGGALLAA